MMKTALGAIVLFGAAALTALTPAAAQADPSAPSDSCTINVGEPSDYYYQGVKAGEIEQQFDICPSDWNYHRVMAHWQWSAGFQSNPAYAGMWVYVLIGSPFNGNVASQNEPYSIKDSPDVEAVSPYSYNVSGTQEEWRAGAELASGQGPTGTGCVQWGSLHYYGNGTEADVAVGGCGPHFWTAPI